MTTTSSSLAVELGAMELPCTLLSRSAGVRQVQQKGAVHQIAQIWASDACCRQCHHLIYLGWVKVMAVLF